MTNTTTLTGMDKVMYDEVQEYQRLQALIKELTDQQKKLKEVIVSQMDGKDSVTLVEFTVDNKKYNRTGLDKDYIKEHAPKTYEKALTTTEYTKFSVKATTVSKKTKKEVNA